MFVNNSVFDSKDYKRSRMAYALQQTIEYLVLLMVADAFLAKILTHIGISDSTIGIISTFVSMAMFIQIGSIVISGTKISSKKISAVCLTLSQVLFALVYVVPFVPINSGIKKILSIVFIFFAYALMNIVWPITYKWGYKFVSGTTRARYSATKEIISLGAGIIFTLISGYVFDKLESAGNISGAFLCMAISMAVLSICNLICVLSMNEEPVDEIVVQKKKLRDIMKNTFGNSGFNKCVFAISMWEFAKYFLVGFMGTFKTNDLVISISLIQVINMIASGARIFVSRQIAKFSDKHGYAAGFQLGLAIAAVAFLVNVFTTKSTWFLVIIYTILYYMGYAGINANSYNILYSYVDNNYISEALAIKNCVAGVTGFASALVAGKLLSFIQENGNNFIGLHIFGQQFLSAVAFVITVFVLLYIKFVLSKEKTIK